MPIRTRDAGGGFAAYRTLDKSATTSDDSNGTLKERRNWMSIVSLPPVALGSVPPFPIQPFTVDQYHQMIAAGLFHEDDRVELLEGWVTPKMPRNPPHDATIGKASCGLARVLPADRIVRVQSAITTTDSEPEPDLAVVPGPHDRYAQCHPGPADIDLLVEVADASLTRDRVEKGRIYARANIGNYWIINLPDRQVEVYTDPTGPGGAPAYRKRQDFRAGQSVPLAIVGQPIGSVAVNDLLPPP